MTNEEFSNLLKDFTSNSSIDYNENLNSIQPRTPILIATPNGSNTGKTTSLKYLILILSYFNENNIDLVYCDPELVRNIYGNNNVNNNYNLPQPPNGWLKKIMLKDENGRPYDLAVVVTVKVEDNNGNTKEIKIGISTHGDIVADIEIFLCGIENSTNKLRTQFLDCDIIISACHKKRRQGSSSGTYERLQEICKANKITINNIQ
ncbi:MAG: hypothetical protein PUI45_02455 [Spirochaetales bacterium]|nr:hypothetical protein [Spirochaetales bacterium]